MGNNFVVADAFLEETTPKVTLALGVTLVVSFSLYVVHYIRKEGLNAQPKTLENFLTARHSVGWTGIGWSLYASAVGSGAITAPAEFGFFGGILGVFAYALATGLPILMIAFFGPKLHAAYPKLLSLSDFIGQKFGPITQIWVVLIVLLNMSAATIAEYTTIASLYGDFVGLNDVVVLFVMLIAATTLSYTAYGGLEASILTDRVQAASSLFLIQVFIVFLVADFDREEIVEDQIAANLTPTEFIFTNDMYGYNLGGYSSLFTLPLSLITATIFSEAMWQRSWASKDTLALRKGSIMAFCLIFLLVSTFGATGILVSWAELVREDINPNLYAFQVFSQQKGDFIVSSVIGVLVILLATTLSQGAVDSLQNGIEATVSGAIAKHFSEKNNLRIGRLLLVVLNVPLIIIGLQRFNILSVFLLDNMICVCAFFPITLGFFDHKFLNSLHRDWIPLTSFFITLAAVVTFTSVRFGSFVEGISYAFWTNTFYEYEPFLFALLFSVFVTSIIYVGVFAYCRGPVDVQEKPTEAPIIPPAVEVEEKDDTEVLEKAEVAAEEAKEETKEPAVVDEPIVEEVKAQV